MAMVRPRAEQKLGGGGALETGSVVVERGAIEGGRGRRRDASIEKMKMKKKL
jgi:hypothetical protein